jgi:hypothetical protein
MISHTTIRAAVLATLKADTDVYAVISKAGWYTLTAPKALKTPAVLVGTVAQPLTGVAGDPRRQTRFSAPLNVEVLVLCEKHSADDADEQLGDVYGKVYDALLGDKTLGITGLHANITGITTGLYPKLGEHVVGAEIMLSCTYDV